jgi:hypothetical protein
MNNKAIEVPIMLHAYIMWNEKLLRMIDYGTRILGLMQRDVVGRKDKQQIIYNSFQNLESIKDSRKNIKENSTSQYFSLINPS